MYTIKINFETEEEMNRVSDLIKKIDGVNYEETYVFMEVRDEFKDTRK